MYFIPHKNTWYSWLVHMRPLYRYGLLLFIAGLLFFGGRGLYAWLDMLVKQEQASIAQLQQQLTQQSLSQCQCIALRDQLPVLRHAIAQHATQCIGTNCCDQCSYIFDEVHKTGLKIIGYHAEKASQKKDWKQTQSIALMLSGSLDQIQTFLTALKKSSRMIQCPSLSLQRSEGTIFAVQCTIQFIAPII